MRCPNSTSSASGFVECSGGDANLDTQIGALNPYAVNPTTGANENATPVEFGQKLFRITPA